MSEVSLEEVERSLLEKDPSIAPGGYWKPKDCLPRWKASVDERLTGLCAEKHQEIRCMYSHNVDASMQGVSGD